MLFIFCYITKTSLAVTCSERCSYIQLNGHVAIRRFAEEQCLVGADFALGEQILELHNALHGLLFPPKQCKNRLLSGQSPSNWPPKVVYRAVKEQQQPLPRFQPRSTFVP